MKSAMKKLLSLMLVAMLLVSAIPFAASADTSTIKLVIAKGETEVYRNESLSFTPGTTTVSDLISAASQTIPANASSVSYYRYGTNKGSCEGSTVLQSGDTAVRVRYEVTEADDTNNNTNTATTIDYIIKDADNNVLASGTMTPANKTSAAASDIVKYYYSASAVSSIDKVWSNVQGAYEPSDYEVKVGDTVTIKLSTSSSSSSSSSTTTPTADKVSKNSYGVYLKIYTNNNLTSAVKTVNITDGYAVDGKVSWSEVQQYVKNNFSASNSLGITIDGIYYYTGSWAANWLNSSYKKETVNLPYDSDAQELALTDNVYLMVMLTGVSGGTVSTSSSSSSSSSTSSNPKTGDTIGTSFLALGVSASALAAAYFVEKKRLAR